MKASILAFSASLSYASAMAIQSPPAVDERGLSSSPFHDCLDTGKSWEECRVVVEGSHFRAKRDAPFHQCLDSGKSWEQCQVMVLQDRSVTGDDGEAGSGIETRNILRVALGAVQLAEFAGLSPFGQSEKCYSVNKLGGTGWLTNTMVENLADSSCSFAVDEALKAFGAEAPALGRYTTKHSGFYQANGGPVAKANVNYFLSTLYQGEFADLNVDLHALGKELCLKGIDHLTGDKGCTAKRKAGLITSHTSVNGGEFNFAQDGADPVFDNGGTCINCIFSMMMEAANDVDKDGESVTPHDE